MLGWLLLVSLTALAAFDALAIAVRTKPSGRAELAVIAFAAFCALLAAPVLVLGYGECLTARSLGIASGVWLAMVWGVASFRGPSARESLRAARALAGVPYAAIGEAWRARSFVVIALGASAAIVLASIVLTVMMPNATWDGFLYHEPMVGFAIQNHGFSMVELPQSQAVQATNGYPRLCESLSLWFVVFTDKTLIELPNALAAPAMVLAAYVLARRFADRITSMGLACMLLLMPQAWSQLCQTYIDLLVAFFAIVLVAFATRPTFRVRDAWIATLGALLFLGSKSSALTCAPALAAIAYGRLAWDFVRRRPIAVIATIACGVALLAGMGAIAPLRNLRAFHDPLWPVSYDSDVLGIHWKGLIALDQLTSSTTVQQAIATAYDAPIGGPADVMARGYGYALVWVLAPFALMGAVWGGIASLADVARSRESERTPFLLLLVAGLVSIATAPSLNGHNARYDLHIVACAMGACAWLLARPSFKRVRGQILAAASVLAVVPLFWMRGPGWYWVSTRHLEDVFHHPLDSRVVLERPEFDVIAAARESQLHAGDLVLFDQQVSFVGALWNFDYSSRVEYLPYESRPAFLRAIAAKHPTWVVVGESDAARKVLEGAREWEYIGPLTPGISAVFHRRGGA